MMHLAESITMPTVKGGVVDAASLAFQAARPIPCEIFLLRGEIPIPLAPKVLFPKPAAFPAGNRRLVNIGAGAGMPVGRVR